jgi:hypothetical protein
MIFKKILAATLGLIMIMTMIASCSDVDEQPNVTDSTPEASSTPAPPVDETTNDYLEAGIPDGIDYDGDTVNIFHWEYWHSLPKEFDIASEDLNGDPIYDAIYKRNLYTEQLLNVDLEFVHLYLETGNINEMIDWCDRLENTMNDPNTPVDIFASYSRCIATATTRGLPQNLSDYNSLDFNKEWWPQYIKDEFDIGGQMFFATGDISTYVLYSMYMIFFNEELVGQHGMENPYTLVENREWTIDKMIKMTSSVYDDMDAVNGKSAGDLFAFTLEWWASDAFIQGADFNILEKATDGEHYMKLSEDFTSEKFGNFIGKMGDWCALDSVYNQKGYDDSASTAFKEERAIFHMGPAETGLRLQEVDFSYGIVPPPMLDPNAQDYITTICEDYSIYAMGRNCADGDRAANVIQTMGYYANKYTTPAVFDVTFKGKFSKTEQMMNMFDKIRGAISFDMGLLYQRQLSQINDWPTEAIRDNIEWSIKASARQVKMMEIMINTLNDNLKALVELS